MKGEIYERGVNRSMECFFCLGRCDINKGASTPHLFDNACTHVGMYHCIVSLATSYTVNNNSNNNVCVCGLSCEHLTDLIY